MGREVANLIGLKFGLLTVLKLDHTDKKQSFWLCQCECGNKKVISYSGLKNGTKSCGCLFKKPRFKDITGMKYNKLTVIKPMYKKNETWHWLCQCECGNQTIVSASNLKSGSTKSCGCYFSEKVATHHLSKSKLYRTWASIKDRCLNPNNPSYNYYGGRGITIYEEWLNDFQKFHDWAYSNNYNDNLTIDRIDNNKGYSPDNCRWVTMKVQNRNKRNNIYLTYKGETKLLIEWAEYLGINYKRIKDRFESGYPIEKILFKGNLLQARGVKNGSI